MKLLVTAGPTREFIDPIRFISNRSSGKMGYAVARAGVARGHDVTLISGPVHLPPPPGVRLFQVVSAVEMLDCVKKHLRPNDALVMAAAVADWRPKRPAPRKLKKRDPLRTLELERTRDILLSIRKMKGQRVFVGFAAETDHVVAEARRKLAEKGLDLIVANDVSRSDAGFDVDTNRTTFLTPGGPPQALPVMSKDRVGMRIVRWIEGAMKRRITRRRRSIW